MARSRAAPDEGNDQDKITHTGLESRPTNTTATTNATLRTKKETICKMGKAKRKQVFVDYFSLIVRTKKAPQSRFGSSLEVFPRVVGKCVFFRRTLTSSKVEVRCVFAGSNSLRQNCVLVLFDKLLSDFFRESESLKESTGGDFGEREVPE